MPRKYKHTREPLTKFDANRLSNACETMKEKLIIWTLLDTGLRVEEFCNLDKNNIDWNQHTLLVYGKNTLGGEKKKRTVYLTDRVRPLLEGWIASNNKMGFGTKNAWEIVRKVARRAMVPNCSPHVLRHTFAVMSLEKGISLPALQRVMGHEDLQTTAIYLGKSNMEAVREYKEKF